ncbi:very long-chain acyl-CoA synthetase/fatty acid transporter [Phyllosticta citribraziliensis]|uniref:Very long-chain acyl-CoA synthetase/fatty acid transporter n=1 Tax=Phyllosticta citribraziliensis TaxID=989973 RepID=A0ABR1M965_9PEZI
MPVPLAALAMAGAAAVTGSMYLDARLGLSYDAWFTQAMLRAIYTITRAERNDRTNCFYDLEAAALDPRTRDTLFLQIPHHPPKEGRSSPHANGDPGSEIRLESHSYGAVYAAVLSFARYLRRAHGVRRGDVVALDMPNSARFVVAWFALWSLGATPAFINYHLKGAGLLHCLRVSTARLVLVGSESEVQDKYAEDGQVWRELVNGAEKGEGFSGQRISTVRFGLDVWDEEILKEEGLRAEDAQRSVGESQDMAMLIYTSGTTGLPKPAVVSWGKAKVAATFCGLWLPLKQGDVVFTAMPLYHTSASLLALLAVLSSRTTLALAPSFSTTYLLPSLHATRATHLQYVGETLRYLLASPPNAALDATHRVHTVFGNGLRPDVWARFTERFNIRTVCEFYAATEGPAGLWNRSSGPFTAGAVGYFGALASALAFGHGKLQVVARVDSETGTLLRDGANNDNRVALCGVDEPGELLFRLPADDTRATFQGYFGDGRASSAKIVHDVLAPGDAWFRTGDVLRQDGARRWWFVDRLGDTFRWKSENVATLEVAGALAAGRGVDVVSDVVVYGVRVPGAEGRAGCAALSLKGAEGKDERWERQRLKVLAEHARNCLPKYAVPVFVRVTMALSVTGTNKLQKHVLQKEGIDPEIVARSGDRIYWLSEGRYERFRKREFDRLMGGGVKL